MSAPMIIFVRILFHMRPFSPSFGCCSLQNVCKHFVCLAFVIHLCRNCDRIKSICFNEWTWPPHFFAWSIIRFSVLFNLRLFNKHAHICLRCCLIRSISRQIQFGRHFASFDIPFCAFPSVHPNGRLNVCVFRLPSFIWTFFIEHFVRHKVARSTKSQNRLVPWENCRFSHARTFG